MAKQEYIVGDCLDFLKQRKAQSIDITVTSPPYNIDLPYGAYKDKLPEETYLDWMENIFLQIKRVTTLDGHFFLQAGGTSENPDKPFKLLQRAQKGGWVLQNQILWVKSISLDEDDSRGHFKPINSKRYLNNLYEFVFHFTQNGNQPIDRLSIGVPYKDKSNIKRYSAEKGEKRCRGNIWYLPYDTVFATKSHPAAFPLSLPLNCIKLCGKTGTVLDPFAGSGTTLLAASILGHDAIGLDIDPGYLEVYENIIVYEEALRNSHGPKS